MVNILIQKTDILFIFIDVPSEELLDGFTKFLYKAKLKGKFK
jgi:hypothetical protein